MKLDELDIALVERDPSQSINLGLVLTRRYYKTLWFSSLFSILPFYLLSVFVLFVFEWHGAILFLWFFKPFYDRVILENLSQLIFIQKKSLSDILLSIRPACRNGLIASLTWHRFSTMRSFSLPIRLLEGLSGKEYRFRLQAITKGMLGSPSGVIFLFILLEQAVAITFLVILFQLIPEGWFNFDFFLDLSSGNGTRESCILLTLYTLVVIFLEPFYVSIGFSLYLNERILSEAWDIDVIFRNMANRLEKTTKKLMVITCFLVSSLICFTPSEVVANTLSPPESVSTNIQPKKQRKQLDTILADPKISPYKVIPLPKKSEKKTWWEDFIEWLFGDKEKSDGTAMTSVNLGGIIKIVLLVALFAALLYVAVRYKSVIDLFQPRVKKEEEKPDVMFGLDIREEALPSDPQAQVIVLIEQGKMIDALSLLYRCTLTKLVHESHITIRVGDTEGDCLRASNSVLPSQTYTYFSQLTMMWQNAVYAHQEPDKSSLITLANTWSLQQFSLLNAQVTA